MASEMFPAEMELEEEERPEGLGSLPAELLAGSTRKTPKVSAVKGGVGPVAKPAAATELKPTAAAADPLGMISGEKKAAEADAQAAEKAEAEEKAKQASEKGQKTRSQELDAFLTQQLPVDPNAARKSDEAWEPPKRKCHRGHVLTCFTTSKDSSACNECCKILPKGTEVWGNKSSKFILCAACYRGEGPPKRKNEGIQATITSRQDIDGVTFYNIKVVEPGEERMHQKRYNDFKEYDKSLRSQSDVSARVMADLPTSGMLGLRHRLNVGEFNDQREEGLQNWLNVLCANVDVELVQKFFERSTASVIAAVGKKKAAAAQKAKEEAERQREATEPGASAGAPAEAEAEAEAAAAEKEEVKDEEPSEHGSNNEVPAAPEAAAPAAAPA